MNLTTMQPLPPRIIAPPRRIVVGQQPQQHSAAATPLPSPRSFHMQHPHSTAPLITNTPTWRPSPIGTLSDFVPANIDPSLLYSPAAVPFGQQQAYHQLLMELNTLPDPSSSNMMNELKASVPLSASLPVEMASLREREEAGVGKADEASREVDSANPTEIPLKKAVSRKRKPTTKTSTTEKKRPRNNVASSSANKKQQIRVYREGVEEEPEEEEDEATAVVEGAPPTKQKRLVKNHQAAQLFRQRQKQHIKALEEQVAQVSTTHTNLTADLHALQAENQAAKQQLRFLQSFVAIALQQTFPLSKVPKPGRRR
eukprot:TRINITY_DN7986_c0_g1_i1.p1 TRINITY_DN7986_c0_g1~~TRINITY_DN7986_c0_g1_i1.p1  ORF type:complete len:313 (+),score=73.09 TRINITY_DN7986_c0_g1_i1:342-1280(+)